jgi:hypothetical protein
MQVPIELSNFHLFGYDISHVLGPPGQKTMFNFRAVLDQRADSPIHTLTMARLGPLPQWRPPPH